MDILEVKNNMINKISFGGKECLLEEKSHLIISKIFDKYLSIINSYTNSNFIIEESIWEKTDFFPEELYDKLKILPEPSYETTFPYHEATKVVSFIIVISYACNMRCTYCYQQKSGELSKKQMTSATLEKILEVILDYKMSHPDKIVQIGLFGGEPLMKENHNLIMNILDFCVENAISIGITTNGKDLEFYLKDLIIYRSLQITICTTIDSINNNVTRCCIENKYPHQNKGTEKLLSILKILVDSGVYVSVETNIDKHNIGQIDEIISYYNHNGFMSSPFFEFGFGRVDDRLYETNYPDIVSYVDILLELGKVKPIPSRFFISFLRTPYELSKKIGCNYNQQEMRYSNSYCWAASSLDEVFYIDPDMNTYRCTYTVGRREYSIMKFNKRNLRKYKIPFRSFEENEKCRSCKIGGYCAGGCMLSAKVNFAEQCKGEREDFEKYLDKLYYPSIKRLLLKYLEIEKRL